MGFLFLWNALSPLRRFVFVVPRFLTLIFALATISAEPRSAAVLDSAEGRRAAAAYRAHLRGVCASANASRDGRRADLESALVEPIASGSFVQANAREVLLRAPSGQEQRAVEFALVLMRREGGRYRFVDNPQLGEVFTARHRLTMPSGLDTLLLCKSGGHHGLYLGTCSFFGDPMPPDNEIETLEMTACGAGASVTLDQVRHHGDTLALELVVEHFQRIPASGEEGPSHCSGKSLIDRASFRIDYRFDGTRWQRVAPLPRAVLEPLEQFG